ncbi:MAG: DUF1573 domain-containing protein [Candidatus Eisenbacteria bacterium]|uniref:DUF1573 domain-containing protein n=1 Tax=Eiseniibacteriota bacterium TaxID=2212470 RepID=A0A948RZS3_UNCEI|nr:DUF1573 domain-containing protein [Candidatus Eisenbacteria bacterium]MBU1947965.1 DUF1573 domain-containing protein [Candidatus Eisenbacteria bacterium]MBU2693411.1 DUF1573 domain-containing protein [Candidatus Eisenbacteria bacterium]
MVRDQRLLNLGMLIIAVIFLFETAPVPADPFGGPAIRFDYREVDFGILPQKTYRDTVFTFQNAGDSELAILDVKTSCGCTAALATESVIPVHGKGTIDVRFDTKRFKGPVTKTITVKSNDPGEPETMLRIKAFIKALVNITPERIDIGLVRFGKTAESTIRLASEKGQDLSVEDVQVSVDVFDWEIQNVADPDSEVVVIKFKLKESAPLGAIRGQIKIVTGFKDMKPIIIPIRGELVHHFQISPSSLNLGSFKIGMVQAPVIVIRPVGTQAFKVVGAESDNPKVRIRLADGRVAGTYEIFLDVSPDIEPGRIKGEILVKTNDPAQPTLTVPVIGYARGEK